MHYWTNHHEQIGVQIISFLFISICTSYFIKLIPMQLLRKFKEVVYSSANLLILSLIKVMYREQICKIQIVMLIKSAFIN